MTVCAGIAFPAPGLAPAPPPDIVREEKRFVVCEGREDAAEGGLRGLFEEEEVEAMLNREVEADADDGGAFSWAA